MTLLEQKSRIQDSLVSLDSTASKKSDPTNIRHKPQIHVSGEYFLDQQKRTVILRGVNLGGSSKLPTTPNGATHLKESILETKNVSFVGRPFPLEEADEHLKRLRHWGFNTFRFLVPWEAIEHSGPGIYDTAYLDYLIKVIEKCAEYEFYVIIDPHQDVWSRFTGGSGAPAWTLEKLGMELHLLDEVGAAVRHQMIKGPLPTMIWPINYLLYASATLFTLFFAGNIFAPNTRIDGQPVQDYMQNHYCNALAQVAKRLKHIPNVIGFNTLNEPHGGYIGYKSVQKHPFMKYIMKGAVPTPLQSMVLTEGQSVSASVYKYNFIKVSHKRLNTTGVRLWREGFEEIWKSNGVWTNEQGRVKVLKDDYFSRINDKPIDFERDTLTPFFKRFTTKIRQHLPDTIMFIEGSPHPDNLHWNEPNSHNMAHAPHWYDTLSILSKRFSSIYNLDPYHYRIHFGKKGIVRSIHAQIKLKKQASSERMQNILTLIGEFGIPFDINNRVAYQTNNFTLNEEALNLCYNVFDQYFLSSTQWNYTSDHSNKYGDLWNEEDLSIFSRDQQQDVTDINSGARGLAGFCRPYARAIAGKPIAMRFDMDTKHFYLEYQSNIFVEGVTEVYLPTYQYPDGVEIALENAEQISFQDQRLLIANKGAANSTIRLTVTPKKN